MEEKIYHNKRDIELKLLEEFLEYIKKPISSILKIGTDFTGDLPLISKYCQKIDGVGQKLDPEGKEYLSKWYSEDFLFEDFLGYETIVSLSAMNRLLIKDLEKELLIEHQIYGFDKAVRLARKNLFFTFEYGQINIFGKDFVCYDRKILERVEKLTRGYKTVKRFLFNPDESIITDWRVIEQKEADNYYNLPQSKDRCLCCLVIIK